MFYPEYVKRLHGTHVKTGKTKADMVEQLRAGHPRLHQEQRRRSRRVRVVRLDRDLPRSPARCISRSQAFEKGLLEERSGDLRTRSSTRGPA